MTDSICINDLVLNVPLNGGAIWPSSVPKLQPIRLSVSLFHSIARAASGDDLRHSIDYSKICSLLLRELSLAPKDMTPDTPGYTLESLADRVVAECFRSCKISHLALKITCDRAPLHCSTVKLEAQCFDPDTRRLEQATLSLCNIQCPIIVGINACEREERQTVVVDVDIKQTVDTHRPFSFRQLSRSLYESVEITTFKTLEALADHIAQHCLSRLPRSGDLLPVVTVSARKPFALIYAGSSEVRIIRNHGDYIGGTDTKKQTVTAALALGSNLGNKVLNIETALRLIEDPLSQVPDLAPEQASDPVIVSVVDTSFLYESSPMYVTDQPSFINAACIVETTLSPTELLRLLKAVEGSVGRVPSIRNGPRAVDLDILFFGDRVIDTRPLDAQKPENEGMDGYLIVPHPKMSEREFVLRPLNDMIPDFIHPILARQIRSLLRSVQPDEALRKVIPFPFSPALGGQGATPHALWPHPRSSKGTNKTRVMATLNVTPDSFSDGALHNTTDTALNYVEEAIKKGTDIVDIGGYSTRPGAAFVTPEEETSRVVPVITAIRSRFGEQILISVDTFRPEVAEAAILAGANCINDVYAFSGPDSHPFNPNGEAGAHLERMKQLARKAAVPVILMHSRGDARQNKDYTDVIEAIKAELGDKVERIVKGKGGVRRWNIIVDPGVGFSKTTEGNLEILRRAGDVINESATTGKINPLVGYPLLIGASRKSFLGTVLATSQNNRQTEPKDRVWATAATVASAVQQGAMIVRVHDVGEMKDVVDVSQAIWG